jgi:predicted methyltransferase
MALAGLHSLLVRGSTVFVFVWLAAVGCRDGGEAADVHAHPAPRSPAPTSGMSQETYDRWRRPERVIAALELADGQIVADVGAGTGYFTSRLAERVGPRGRVVATDIDPRALSALTTLAEGAASLAATDRAPVEVRRVTPDDPGLEPARYDRILLAQVDHLLTDRASYLRRLRGALAPGGRVAVVNRLQHRASLLQAASDAGYVIAADVTDLPGQFLVLLVPEAPR